MKKPLFLIYSLVLFSVFSCTKEEAEKLECETENIGYITITCTSDNPYNVYIDGVFEFQLPGNTFRDDYEVSAGTHTLKAEQVSGYILYPTIREITVSISHCDKRSWVFP